MYSFHVDAYDHKRGPTSRYVVGTQIQRDCNFEVHIHKDFSHSHSSSGSNTRLCSTTAEPTKCTDYGAIQKGSVQCTVGAVSISCLLCTKHDSGNCDIFEFKGIIEFHRNQGNGKCLSVL